MNTTPREIRLPVDQAVTLHACAVPIDRKWAPKHPRL
jgi:hypothetical protein